MDAATRNVIGYFEQVSRIPRRSRQEAAIARWLEGWAHERGLATRRDAVGNLLIAAPGNHGLEERDTVVLQGHLDMVCEKTPDSPHDFSKDPISLVYEGEWLTADRTTLGADNGIAIAMAMAILDDADAAHPPLELLFTIDEETGLTGATGLSPDLLTGKTLLNIDSEDEGVLTVGCAGGRQTDITFPLTLEATPAGLSAFVVGVSGCKGGHSGVDIHEERANANVIVARALEALAGAADARLARVDGGTAHNAIPRDAKALVALPAARVAAAEAALANLQAALRGEYTPQDVEVTLTLTPADMPQRVLSAAAQGRLVAMLLALPHGVAATSRAIEGLVQTSNNLATIRTDLDEGVVALVSSQRSSIKSQLDALSRKVEVVAELAGAAAVTDPGYPGWEPNMGSPLLAHCRKVYRDSFGKEPVVEIIHAGLECGVIGSKYPGMDMISFGPTIKYPHSPDEKLHLPSVGMVYAYLKAILAAL